MVSGGLGPTHDDRTVELLARVHRTCARRSTRSSQPRSRRSRAGSPSASSARSPTSCPGSASRRRSRRAASRSGSPGPRRRSCSSTTAAVWRSRFRARRGELRRLWPNARRSIRLCRRSLARADAADAPRRCASSGPRSPPSRASSTRAGGEGDGFEATVCARDLEIHVDLWSARRRGRARRGWTDALRRRVQR